MIDKKSRQLLGQFWSIADANRRTFLISFSMALIVLVMEWAQPLLLESGLTQIGAGNREELTRIAWTFFAVLMVDYLARSGFNYVFSLALLRTINQLRDRIFRHVIHMKMAFFDRQPVGALITRTISDCEALGETLRAGAATIVVDMLAVLVIFSAMIKMDFGLSTGVMIATPILFLVIQWCGRKLRDKFMAVRKALAASNAFMTEGIMGVEILQLFRQRKASGDEFREINKTYRHATIVNNVYDALLYSLIDGIAAATTALILFMAFNLRFGLLEVATVIVFLTLIERIFNPIRDFSGKFAVIQQALAALERVFSLLNNPAKIPQGEGVLEGNNLDIRFDDVRFRYTEDGPKVLQGINFSVKPGQTVALVGQTGSGKSTIGKLLTRAYDGYEGDILVDGKEIRTLNYHGLRRKIAVVHQEVELFPGSLRDNITMFDPSITEETILEAIRLVRAEHLVAQLSGGLDFMVTEGGGNLSAGQQQLIVFARALAHDAPIVLMDEATSSVDSVTEAWIQTAISQIMKHKTVMVVAHRLSTVAAADRILVLKGGEIIEEGKHEELVAIEGGYYANLVEASKLQSGLAGSVMV